MTQLIDTVLWEKILHYDLDAPVSEYGFSLRLANENYWTRNFTRLTIIEYKKFMYLAAISDMMVSPSEIVDTVWHQHLIFTKSYQDFCDLIGKQLQHIPSTHNKEDFEKFRLAKERTKKLYNNIFGEQPVAIWKYNNMYDSLDLKKSKIKIRSFINIALLIFPFLLIPAYFLLQPLYSTIGNPDFIIGYGILALCFMIGLLVVNYRYLASIISRLNRHCFIFDLDPAELVYLKSQKLEEVINGVVNELLKKNAVLINSDHTIEIGYPDNILTLDEHQTLDTLSNLKRTFYPALLRQLVFKPVFSNTANCMNAFRKYFNKSKKFGNLFYLNFLWLSFILIPGFTRLATGLLRDKPVTQISIVMLLLTGASIYILYNLSFTVCTQVIPRIYKSEILPVRKDDSHWQWSYFLLGSSALIAPFIPLVTRSNSMNHSGSSCGTSSCGSSCGSSCSSCGGCGGD